MNDLDYPTCINELYQSEVLGEAAFLALMKAAKNEREKYHFGTLLQLETETKARLRPFLFRHGLDLDEPQGDGETVAGFLALYQQREWLDFLAQLKPMIDQFLARFREIAEVGPAEDKDILESMIRHEESFVHWIEKETTGEEGALDVAISQLQYPLPAPLAVRELRFYQTYEG
jgi:hypothetical protein